MMHKWEKAYKENKFSIKTDKPSRVVGMVVDHLKDGSRVLDLGCGAGRNAVYLAGRGFHVDAVDVADLDFLSDVPQEIMERINFRKCHVEDAFSGEKYGLIIAARLFQYISKDELENLFASAWQSLEDDGIFVSSYTVEGGIFDRDDIEVSKYAYPIEVIEKSLHDHGFKNIAISSGSSESKYVPYSSAIKTFDIIACR
ncbi:MAG: methyltransferase domain-containing protein [Candidatus Moranbacteria bacterium]|nr:methyltransferase domain-containing protein [Candidatus Moranbacteria bacterium]